MCSCGCNTCDLVSPLLVEGKQYNYPISENLRYHIKEKVSITENTFRAHSVSHARLLLETRFLFNEGVIDLKGEDKKLFLSTDIGKIGIFENRKVMLDYPLVEAEYQGRDVDLNKPKRGGSKKFYVYVKDPKTKKVKKVSFGDTTGLKAKINDPKARQAFTKRHNCAQKKDKTKASYWSCRLPRYASLLGLKGSYSGFW